MKKFTKTVLLRRNTASAAFRVDSSSETHESDHDDLRSTRSEPAPAPPPPPPAPPRTREDESFVLNTARIKEIDELKKETQEADEDMFNRQFTAPEPSTSPDSDAKVTDSTDDSKKKKGKNSKQNKRSSTYDDDFDLHFNIVDDFIERLNMRKIGAFFRRVMIQIIKRIVRSPYINTINDGRVHIHSFGLGVAMTALVVLMQPYLVVYLDSWMISLQRLFKHLTVWLVVGGVVSYTLNPKRQVKKKTDATLDAAAVLDPTLNDDDDFVPVQYSIKPTNKVSPKSAKKKAPAKTYGTPRKQSNVTQLELLKLTEQTQAIEKARLDVEMSRKPIPSILPSNYSQYMNVANKSEKERQQYRNFVGDNREDINLKKAVAFNEKI